MAHFEYADGVFDNPEAYVNLKAQLDKIDAGFGQCTNKLLYCAVSPLFYEVIFNELAKSGLNIPCGGDLGWTRVLVEKPFGKDTETAEKLERQLASIFKEEQIFRIDHYLAKETIQNILTFRFSNPMFEPVWNAKSIEKVHIKVLEKNDVGERGEFYDGVGALRDIGQNHILQMLALIAMERPSGMEAADVRKKRATILKRLVFYKSTSAQTVRAQYTGFREEMGVTADSQTETYFKLTAFIKSWRWRKVPFVLESGKALGESRAEIVVYFKKKNTIEQNVLRFRIQPDEGIEIVFWVKKPGFENEYQKKNLSFSYDASKLETEVPDAYERVLYDCVRGDQTLFASTDEVRYSWKFITPILEKLKNFPLASYERGSEGPVDM